MSQGKEGDDLLEEFCWLDHSPRQVQQWRLLLTEGTKVYLKLQPQADRLSLIHI